MVTICGVIQLVSLCLLVAHFRPSSADYPNFSNSASCSPRPGNSTSAAFKTNLNTLLSILEQQAPQNYGFYKTTIGKRPDELYGLVRCRADVSAQDCATCIKDSINATRTRCSNSRYNIQWFRWCYLQYSKQKFFGQWEDEMAGMSYDNITTDDPTVASTGMTFMRQLTSEVPDEPFLFKTGSVSVGRKGKRYGLVQCNRDLSKSNCGRCLAAVGTFFHQLIGNKSSYEVTSNGCLLSYNKYEFYFNYSLPTSNAAPASASRLEHQISHAALAAVLMLLLTRGLQLVNSGL